MPRRTVVPPAAAAASARPVDGPSATVLGIDPGTRVVGWGVIEVRRSGCSLVGAGVIEAGKSRDSIESRLGRVQEGVERLLASHSPAVVVVEEAFAARNVQSALRIGEGRGVVLACAARAGRRVVQYPPAVAKKTLVGNGAAHKSQVAGMVARVLGLAEPPTPLDATDALALALTHYLRASTAARLG